MKYVFTVVMVLTMAAMPMAHAGQNSIFVDVNGLVCDFCARALEKVFNRQENVDGIHVDLDTKVVRVDLKPGANMEDELLTKLITDSGYNVEAIRRGEVIEDAPSKE